VHAELEAGQPGEGRHVGQVAPGGAHEGWRELLPAQPSSLVLSVDDGPEGVLREVAQQAGVTGFPLP
jgi:hypothetical protein